jgi:hypothetical protein
MKIMMDAPSASQPEASVTEDAIRQLEALGAELEKLGYRARLDIVVGGPPSLHVQNPEPGAGALPGPHLLRAARGPAGVLVVVGRAGRRDDPRRRRHHRADAPLRQVSIMISPERQQIAALEADFTADTINPEGVHDA